MSIIIGTSSVDVDQSLQFREQLAKVYYKDEPLPDFDADPDVQFEPPKFGGANVVVVGPIPKDDGLSGTNGEGMYFNTIRSEYYKIQCDFYC